MSVIQRKDVDGFKLWYSRSPRSRNGVGILVDKELKKQVVEIRRVNDRMMTVKLVVRGLTFKIISAYDAQAELDEEIKKLFWELLYKVVRDIPHSEKIFQGGDFNGHIGTASRGHDDVHDSFNFGDRNEEFQF